MLSVFLDLIKKSPLLALLNSRLRRPALRRQLRQGEGFGGQAKRLVMPEADPPLAENFPEKRLPAAGGASEPAYLSLVARRAKWERASQ